LVIAGIAVGFAKLVSKICIVIIYKVIAGPDTTCTAVGVASVVGLIALRAVVGTTGVAFGVDSVAFATICAHMFV
jgi:hypothetical protein